MIKKLERIKDPTLKNVENCSVLALDESPFNSLYKVVCNGLVLKSGSDSSGMPSTRETLKVPVNDVLLVP